MSETLLPGGWTLADPLWLLALLLIPLAVWWRGRRSRPVLVIPRVARWAGAPAISLGRGPSILAGIGLALLIVGLARPQQLEEKKQVRQKGYDIMLAIDLSPSMLAEDYEGPTGRINRLQAIQPIIEAFISRRPTDRIGVVIYGGRAYTLSPLTFDHEWLARQISRLRVGLVEDATAVGDGLGLAVSRLEQSEKEKDGQRKGAFIILLTDGSNNSGVLAPRQAAELAKKKGIPVYTIGAGQPGVVPMPVIDNAGRKLGYRQAISDLDEDTLQRIAETTGGKFFRAMDVGTAEAAFAAIDKKQRIEFSAKAQLRAHEWFCVGYARNSGFSGWVVLGTTRKVGKSSMTFYGVRWEEPQVLLLIPLVPLATWLIFRGKAGQSGVLKLPKVMRRWAGARAVVDRPGATRRRGGFWLAAGVMLALMALARPQYGQLEETVFDQSREVLLALDLSASMLADDVKPTRLERAKLLIGNLLDELKGERVGLAVFAGTSFLQVPLSSDYEVLRDILPGLDPSYLPQAGTDYTGMLRVATEAFGQSTAADRFLIILSDGEAHDPGWKTALEELKKKKVKIIALGIGTAAGSLLPDSQGGVIKDARGAAVLTKLEPATLEALAEETGGVYREASNWVDLQELLSETIEQGKSGEFSKTREARQAERFQWVLAPAVFLLALSLALEMPVLPTRRRVAMGPVTDGEPALPPVMKKTTKLVSKDKREQVAV